MRTIARFCLLMAAALTLFVAGCNETKREPKAPTQTVAIHVGKDGAITYDGATVTKDELKSKLTALKSANGGVKLSYDKDAQGNAVPQVAEVIAVINEAGISPTQ